MKLKEFGPRGGGRPSIRHCLLYHYDNKNTNMRNKFDRQISMFSQAVINTFSPDMLCGAEKNLITKNERKSVRNLPSRLLL